MDDEEEEDLSPSVISFKTQKETNLVNERTPKLVGILKTPSSEFASTTAKKVRLSVKPPSQSQSSFRRYKSTTNESFSTPSILKSRSAKKRKKRVDKSLSLDALLDHETLPEWDNGMATPPKIFSSLPAKENTMEDFFKASEKKSSKKGVARTLFDISNLHTECSVEESQLSPSVVSDTTKLPCVDSLLPDETTFHETTATKSFDCNKIQDAPQSPTMLSSKNERFHTISTSGLGSLESTVVDEKTMNDGQNIFISPPLVSLKKKSLLKWEIPHDIARLSQSTPIDRRNKTKKALRVNTHLENIQEVSMEGQKSDYQCDDSLLDELLGFKNGNKEQKSSNRAISKTDYPANKTSVENELPPSPTMTLTSDPNELKIFNEKLETTSDSRTLVSLKKLRSDSLDDNMFNESEQKSEIKPENKSVEEISSSPCMVQSLINKLDQSQIAKVCKEQSSVDSLLNINASILGGSACNKQTDTSCKQEVIHEDIKPVSKLTDENLDNFFESLLKQSSELKKPFFRFSHDTPEPSKASKFSYPKAKHALTENISSCQMLQSFELPDTKPLDNLQFAKSEFFEENKELKAGPIANQEAKQKNSSDGFIDMDALTQFPMDDINSQSCVESNNNTENNHGEKRKFDKIEPLESKPLCLIVNKEVKVENEFIGFQTGNGKRLKISDQALKNATKMIEDESINFHKDSKETIAMKKETTKGFSGFQTGNGNKVEISDRALKEANKMFQEETIATKKETTKGFSGFQTGNGNKVEISDRALKEAKKMFQEETIATKKEATKGFSGFQTGNGNKVQVSDKALKESKKMFEEETITTKKEATKGFSGFQTDNGNKVEISDRALKEAKKMFEEETIATKKEATKGFSGFQTGNGNKVEVSDKALKEAKKMFEEETIATKKEATKGFSRFQTGSGNKVEVSDRALKEAKKMFQEETIATKKEATKGFSGFQTGNGNKVQVSDKALKESKAAVKNQLTSNKESFKKETCNFNERAIAKTSTPDQTPKNIKRSHIRKTALLSRFSDYGSDREAKFTVPLIPLRTSPEDQIKESEEEIEEKSEETSLNTSKNSSFTAPFKEQPSAKPVKDKTKFYSFCPFTRKRRNFSLKENKTVYKKQDGRMFLTKRKTGKKTFAEFANYYAPQIFTRQELKESYGLTEDVLNMSTTNALSFAFDAANHFSASTMQKRCAIVGDGMPLQFSEDSKITVAEFINAFLGSSNVDKKLVSSRWIENNYRFIVWKLACYERSYPEHFSGCCLTPSNVMFQLKYRYDKEIEHAERSCLKRICEKDDVSTRRLCLCVTHCGVKAKAEGNGAAKIDESRVIYVTDGWYEIKALLDTALSTFVKRNKIAVGTKLLIYGAEIVGADQACLPLDAPETMMLKLNCNSVRRASWEVSLGYQKHKMAFHTPLHTLYSEGGMVGCVNILIARKYPPQWMEKMEGRCVFRSLAGEEEAKKIYEEEKQKRMERVYAKVTSEYQSTNNKRPRRQRKLDKKYLERLRDGKEIYELMNTAPDPASIEQLLTASQKELAMSYKERKREEEESEMRRMFDEEWSGVEFAERKVSRLQRFRVLCTSPTAKLHKDAILTVWKPTNDISERWQEGCNLTVYNLSASSSRYKHVSCQVQLSATNTTRYVINKASGSNFIPRKVYRIDQLLTTKEVTCNEIDVVGYVVSIQPTKVSPGMDQTVYVCDNDSQRFLAVKFWNGIASLNLENVICENELLAFSNLQWNKARGAAYNDLSSISCNPKQTHLRASLKRCQALIQQRPCLLEKMSACLSSTQPKDAVYTPSKCEPSPTTTDTTPLSLPSEKLKARHKLQMKKRLSLERYNKPSLLSPLPSTDVRVLKSSFKPPSAIKKPPP